MTQMDLRITDPGQRRELLEELEIPGSNATLLAAILWQFVALPNCYLSQDRLANRLKVKSRKTIGRAIAKLQKMGIVAAARYHEPSVGAVVNHYSIVWSEVALIVAKQSTKGTPECPIATLETNGTVERDQWDTCDGPMGQLSATNGTLRCPIREEVETVEKKTTIEPVVVSPFLENCSEDDDDDDSCLCRTSVSAGVWSEVGQRLQEFGVVATAKAIESAQSRGWHPSRVEQLIDQAQQMNAPASHLVRWITLDSAPPPPKRKLVHDLGSLPCGASIEAGKVMQRARAEGWPHERLQAAITEIEQKWKTKEAIA